MASDATRPPVSEATLKVRHVARLLFFFCCSGFHNEYCWGPALPEAHPLSSLQSKEPFEALLPDLDAWEAVSDVTPWYAAPRCRSRRWLRGTPGAASRACGPCWRKRRRDGWRSRSRGTCGPWRGRSGRACRGRAPDEDPLWTMVSDGTRALLKAQRCPGAQIRELRGSRTQEETSKST